MVPASDGPSLLQDPRWSVEVPVGQGAPLLVADCGPCRTSDDFIRCLVVITGELDAYTATCIGDHLTTLIVCDEVILDVSGVSFISSAGARLIECCHQSVAAHGGLVWIHDPSARVRRLLEILGIDDLNICHVSGDPTTGRE